MKKENGISEKGEEWSKKKKPPKKEKNYYLL